MWLSTNRTTLHTRPTPSARRNTTARNHYISSGSRQLNPNRKTIKQKTQTEFYCSFVWFWWYFEVLCISQCGSLLCVSVSHHLLESSVVVAYTHTMMLFLFSRSESINNTSTACAPCQTPDSCSQQSYTCLLDKKCHRFVLEETHNHTP